MVTAYPRDSRLRGPYTPMRFEATVDDCIVVEGEIPKDLNGGFYRCGPTWKRPTIQNCNGFPTMDGMVQGLIFREGKAEFRNRWVRTPKYLAEEQAGRALFEWADGFEDWRGYGMGEVVRNRDTEGVPQGTTNVNVFPFAGQLIASGEQGGPPIALDPFTLDTVGVVPWSNRLSQGIVPQACYGDAAFTAHPKWDHETGVVYGLAYRDVEPYVTLHWVSPDGTVATRDLWDAPYASNLHDLWLTEGYVVLAFQPFINDSKRIAKELSIFGWEPERPIVLALVPRDDIDGEIRWITADIPPQYVMHTMSGNTSGNRITLDAPVFDRPPFPMEDITPIGVDFVPFWKISASRLGRWTIDLDTGKVTSETLDDRPVEMPKVDERYYGKPYESGFMLGGRSQGEAMSMDSIVHRNFRTGAESVHQIREGAPVCILEGTFAPRTVDAPEGDGYFIVPVSRFKENSSFYAIYDTDDVAAGPIAKLELPFMLGFTPHGHWMDFN